MKIDRSIIQKFDRPGPRYTSYPTAPEWDPKIQQKDYRQKLAAFGLTRKTLSLYVHIPFCESLCYFCGCMMNVRKNEDRFGDEYLDHLENEIRMIAAAIGKRPDVKQLHWGGGTPSFLSEVQMRRLFAITKEYFNIDAKGEIAIEVDPRRVTRSKVKTLRQLGFNRISIGLQDFDPQVQAHVNRVQPLTMVQDFHGWCREEGFASVNFDLIYGMPYQTRASFARTIADVIALRPDRIALYSFAYVPWLKKHQQKLDVARMPSADEKLDIFIDSRETLLNNGYDAIAMDHFALKEDELAKAFRGGSLYRNFMGYTVKPADEFIGVGVSAIGFLENAFFQNYKTLPQYYGALSKSELPVERGKDLSRDDTIRQWVIRSLMCAFIINKSAFRKTFDENFDEYFVLEKDHLEKCQSDGLVEISAEKITVTELGKIFVRNICMGFDMYLRQKDSHQRFSRTV